MEDGRLLKHVCKLCNKRFLCGRSLGGHMRSHLINNSGKTDEKLSIREFQDVNNSGNGKTNIDAVLEEGINASYGLRKNPKKSHRLSDLSKDQSSVNEKLCRECGKEFWSWKALFGHMKCHSERVSSSSFEEEEEKEEEELDCLDTNGHQKLVMDSQSDNETLPPKTRKRSRRRKTTYLVTANSSSLSFTTASSSVSEIEQEEQEVAMSLVMLSMDVSQRVVGLNSFTESSGNNSVFLQTPSAQTNRINEVEGKTSVSKVQKLKKVDGYKKLKLDDSSCGFLKVEDQMLSIEKTESDQAQKKCEVLNIHKRSNFKCTTCNKIFHSYQALGGHKASHKKTKAGFASRVVVSEISIETEFPVNPAADSLEGKPETRVSKKSKEHECPICLKVFTSGQALGGHKRSHLTGTTEAKNDQAIQILNPDSETRDFLDLNLPAPVEEESKDHLSASFKPWWVGSSLKHEDLLGLISN